MACTANESGGSNDITAVAGIPVVAGATESPGTDLGNGFSVARGTVLVGRTLPTGVALELNGVPLEDAGWRALLVVTGSVPGVVEDYTRQAAANGLLLEPINVGGYCNVIDATFTCDAVAEDGPVDDGRRLTLRLWRAGASALRGPVSHLFLQYSETGSPSRATAVEPPTIAPFADQPLPTDWPALPGPGQPYEVTGASPLRVVDGSRLLAPPSPSVNCTSRGSTALFAVTKDPRDVIDGYAGQGGHDLYRRDASLDDGVTVYGMSWRGGGGTYAAESFTTRNGETYLLVDHCDLD